MLTRNRRAGVRITRDKGFDDEGLALVVAGTGVALRFEGVVLGAASGGAAGVVLGVAVAFLSRSGVPFGIGFCVAGQLDFDSSQVSVSTQSKANTKKTQI